MAKRKKKPNIHKVIPVIIREVQDNDEPIVDTYIPLIQENILKAEPETEPMDEEFPSDFFEVFEEPIEEELIEPEIVMEYEEIVIENPVIVEPMEDSNIEEVEILREDGNIEVIEIPTKEFLEVEISKIEEKIEKLKPIKNEKKNKVKDVKTKTKRTKNDNNIINSSPDNTNKKKLDEDEVISEKEVKIQDHDIILNNNSIIIENSILESLVQVNNDSLISLRFKNLSMNSFELRYKGIKVYDSRINKGVEFGKDYVTIDSRRYPYSNLRIINK